MFRNSLRPLALVGATLLWSGSTFAADVQQTLTDAAKRPLPNVVASLENQAGATIATSKSDAKGVVRFHDIPPGTYNLTGQGPNGVAIRLTIVVAEPKPAPAAPADAAVATTLPPVVITTSRFKDARIELSPEVGTTVHTVNQGLIDTLGEGNATSFDDVLLRLPGVDQDSKASGSLHVRDDHGDVQYRIDGIQLPEAIAGFGTSIDTRFVDQIDFLTGALPAQYGLRTAGIVEIQTKEGTVTPGGTISLGFGSHDTFEPSIELFGTEGRLSYYVSGSFNSSTAGIENPRPTRDPAHDNAEQTKSFGDFSYVLDDDTRIGLLFGTYNAKFQIPTNPDQSPQFALAGFSDPATGLNNYPSTRVNEDQREENRFFILSFQKTIGDLNYQLSAFHQYSELHFDPDPIGDLIYNGVSSDTLRSNAADGIQFDLSYKLNDSHTVRVGTELQRQTTQSNNSVSLFSADNGVQTSNLPMTITDNSEKVGDLSSVYLQDEWTINSRLTANYGIRFDHVAAFTNEEQWSPRLNIAYKLTDDTALHAGYSKYFSPPPQELASQRSIDLYENTTNEPEVATSQNVKAERTNYYDAGLSQKVTPDITVDLDAYYKSIKNLIDEGQFGQALILSPFNYAVGYAKGLELSATYNSPTWSGYANFAYQKAQGKDIISGQSLFGTAELAYIANNYIYLDHNQTYTMSGGVTYKFGDNRISSDALLGSGLRRTPLGGAPNSATLPEYIVANATFTHTWKESAHHSLETRFSILNMFDKSYLLRDGTGVGVGAPQYGLRRTFFTGITASF